MDDEQLVEQFQHGHVHVFDELVLRYQDKVLNTCFRRIGKKRSLKFRVATAQRYSMMSRR
ncbi:hypothetical protein JXA02_13095 [candidate division KSB1 bacterium]|nr:hypothetical protein [candidate division KSB1 bacterium]